MEDFYKGLTELDALLNFLKELGCNQGDIAKTISFNTDNERLVFLSSSTISNARKDKEHPRNKLITGTLKKEFSIRKSSTKLNKNETDERLLYRFEISNEKQFKKTADSINREKRKKNEEALQKEKFKQNKLALFQNKQYVIYDRNEEGIERHIAKFHADSTIEILHADPAKLYRGNYRLDGPNKYLIISASLSQSQEKSVEMMIPIGKTKAPDFALGICVSASESGDGLVGSTLVLVADPEKTMKRGSFSRRENIPEEEIHPDIQRYLTDKRLNRIAVPKRGVTNLGELKNWLDSKTGAVSQEATAKTASYCGDYRMFYYSDELQEYHVKIKNDLMFLEAFFYRIKTGETEWSAAGKGQVSLYANTLYIHLGERDKRSFLQIGIGGTHVERLQCFRGTISGLDHFEQYMVSYPAVWIPEAVLAEEGEDETRAKLRDLLESEKIHSIQVRSPDALKLKNLFSSSPQGNYKIALGEDR